MEILEMGHTFGAIILAVAALFGLYTAWLSGVAPARFAEQLGLTIANAGGLNEIRAQYAGFFLAIAAVCAVSLIGVLPRQAGFVVLVVVFGGLLGGRLVSLALNGGFAGFGPTIRALYAIDALGLALSVTAMAVDRAA
jgi:hypothetical protein